MFPLALGGPAGLQLSGSNCATGSAAGPPLPELRGTCVEERQDSCPRSGPEHRGAVGTAPRVTGCSLELPEVTLPPAWLCGGRVPGVSQRLPRPAPYWVSAAPGLGQGGSRPVVSRSAQLELLSWDRRSGLDLQPPEMLLCLTTSLPLAAQQAASDSVA